MADSDSIKLCECGCGQPAPIAKRNDKQFGHIKGQPVRFICGHHTRRHGHSIRSNSRKAPTPTYASWCAMLSRCANPKDNAFDRYGGRGIKVCDRWRSFENFLADMGERLRGTTLDRYPDVNGNYQPGNCRWATWKEQENNRRNNRLITFNDRTRTLQQWADELRIGATTIDERVKRGWSIDRALTEPVRTTYRFSFGGKQQTLDEWAKELGTPIATLDWRLRRGWPIEKALGTPSRKKAKAGQGRRR